MEEGRKIVAWLRSQGKLTEYAWVLFGLMPLAFNLTLVSLAVLSGGLSGEFLEGSVELGKRVEPDLVGDFADPLIRVEQQVFGLFDAKPGQVFDESHFGRILEDLAKVAHGGVHGFGGFLQAKALVEIGFDESAGSPDGLRFAGVFLELDRIANGGEVLGEYAEHADEAFVLLLREHLRLEVGFFQRLKIDVGAPVQQLTRDPIELGLVRLIEEDLSGLEEGDKLVADSNGNHGVAHAGEAAERLGLHLRGALHLGLHFEAGDAAFVGLGHQSAERVFALFATHRYLEGLDGADGERQAAGLRKGPLVFPEYIRLGESAYEFATLLERVVLIGI